MYVSYRNRALSIGAVWGVLSGAEGFVAGNPLSWPRTVGREIFYYSGLPAVPPVYFYILGITVWSILFFLVGTAVERHMIKRQRNSQARPSSREKRLKGDSGR